MQVSPPPFRAARVARLRDHMRGIGLDALLITPANKPLDEALAEALGIIGDGRAGFEGAHLTVNRHHWLQTRLSTLAPQAMLENTEGLVERLRIVKDEWELGIMAEAGRRLSDAAKCIIPKALEGMAEREVAAVVEAELRR